MRHTPRDPLAAAVTMVVAVLAFLAAAGPAVAAFGDDFDLLPINDPPNSLMVPALPGESKYFWAGACDRAAAPDPGGAIAGGLGTLPTTVETPTFDGLASYLIANVAAPPRPAHRIDWRLGFAQTPTTMWSVPPSWRLAPVAQAGAHPDGSAAMAFHTEGNVDNIVVSLPPGFVGNPNAVDKCTAEQFTVRPQQCPPQTQVGVLSYRLAASTVLTGANAPGNEGLLHVPVFNLEPREGNVAELGLIGLSTEGQVTARIVAKARTNGDFGVTAFVGQIPSALPLFAQNITLWGVPWAAHNDVWRAPEAIRMSPPTGCFAQPGAVGSQTVIPASGLPPTGGCRQSYEQSWGPIRPFLSNPTECDGVEDVTHVATDAYQRPGAFTVEGDPDLSDPDWKTADSPAPPVSGCEKLPFDPAASFQPSSTGADSASGLSVDISVPQNDEAPAGTPWHAVDAFFKSDAGRAAAHLDKTVVRFPEGLAVNPSGATGLEGCSDAQMGVTAVGNPYLFNNQEPSCPDGSKIGTVEVTTPLLEGSPNLTGEMILGTPKSTDPRSGEMFRLFLVVRNPERGLLAKVYGSSVTDPATGRIVATFDKNPQVPVENIKVQLKGGARGLLALPQTCGARSTASEFTPWSAAHGAGGPVRGLTDSFTVAGDCSFGFSPGLEAGMDTPRARANGTFSFRFTRRDGEQWLRGLTASLPQGLLANVKNLALCTDAQANAAACPQASKIGIVDAKAGSGDPFVLEHKGEVFLTDGYKGGEYGLAVKIRPVAGPFRGAAELSPIVVRQAIHVDRKTAQVTAISDPFPLIHHGVPLRVREVTVLVNRDRFMLNPSGCDTKAVGADIASAPGTVANLSNPFQASSCARLAFKPKLALRLTGRKQTRTGKHPGIRAVVRQRGIGEAGIAKAEVRLPKSLALDVDNAQALCEFDDGTRPDLENHCPKGSIVGRARAVTPLLNRPLTGNVYFVKNVRRSSSGNLIRTLPTIVVALRGEIAVNLVGESNVKKGKLVNTFAQVPDAPISRFNLNVKGGKNGILAVTRTRKGLINLCATPKRHIAEADIDGHNGKRHDRDIRMKTPCTNRSKNSKAQRRKAAAKRRAAANRRKGGRDR